MDRLHFWCYRFTKNIVILKHFNVWNFVKTYTRVWLLSWLQTHTQMKNCLPHPLWEDNAHFACSANEPNTSWVPTQFVSWPNGTVIRVKWWLQIEIVCKQSLANFCHETSRSLTWALGMCVWLSVYLKITAKRLDQLPCHLESTYSVKRLLGTFMYFVLALLNISKPLVIVSVLSYFIGVFVLMGEVKYAMFL